MLRLVAFGDSTTAPRGALTVYADLLSRELPRRGLPLDVINAGVGGNTTEAARARWETDVLARRPDIVVIQFGINDAAVDVWKTPPATEPRVSPERYAENLCYFVGTLRIRRGDAILMTPNPMRWTPELQRLYGKPPYHPDDPDGFNTVLHSYAERARAVAREHDVPLIDVYAAYQNRERQPGVSVDDLLLDGMHPGPRGHRLVADLLAAVLIRRGQ